MKSLSILIVEDDDWSRNVFALLLQQASHEVTCAAHGRDALALLRVRRFDVVLTDIIMPEADGLEVITAAQKLQPRARIVAMTGGSSHMGQDYCARLAEAMEGRPVLLKPFNAQELIAAVENEISSGDPLLAQWYGFGASAPGGAADQTLATA